MLTPEERSAMYQQYMDISTYISILECIKMQLELEPLPNVLKKICIHLDMFHIQKDRINGRLLKMIDDIESGNQ